MFQGFVGHNQRRKKARIEFDAEPWEGAAGNFELVESNFKSAPDADEIVVGPLKVGRRTFGNPDLQRDEHTDAFDQWPAAESHVYVKVCAKAFSCSVVLKKIDP